MGVCSDSKLKSFTTPIILKNLSSAIGIEEPLPHRFIPTQHFRRCFIDNHGGMNLKSRVRTTFLFLKPDHRSLQIHNQRMYLEKIPGHPGSFPSRE